MSLEGKNIFITGINGFIGNAAAKYFLRQKAHVIGLVRDFNRKTDLETQAQCSIVVGDILDRGLVQNVVSKYEVDYVLHLASQPIVSICHNDPYSAYMTNVMGLLNVMEACRSMQTPPEKIIVMVSDKYYGATAELPYKENTAPVVADTYCTSKICQDFIALSYALTYGLPVVTVRSGNIYGPGDFNLSRLIPKSIMKLLCGKSPVIYSHSAEFVREFMYTKDLCLALEILFRRGIPGEPYNVGGTEPLRVIEVVEKLQLMIDADIPIEIKDVGFSEISEQYLDASKLQNLGWKPQYSLDRGLADTVDFYADYVENGGKIS